MEIKENRTEKIELFCKGNPSMGTENINKAYQSEIKIV